MRIARAAPEDAARLTTIAFAAKRQWGYPDDWIFRWKEVLTITPDYISANPTYTAAIKDEVVGFYALVLKGSEAFVDHLWVTPAAMRKGIGSALFRHCEERAKKAGASRLKVESDPNAEGFYQAMGASTVGHRPATMDGGKRSLPLLEKIITTPAAPQASFPGKGAPDRAARRVAAKRKLSSPRSARERPSPEKRKP